MPATLEAPIKSPVRKAAFEIKDVRSVLAHLSPSSPKVHYVLHTPVFSFSELEAVAPEITYRRINSWDEAGLVCCHRQTKDTGWRRFSLAELVLLQAIADLQDFGFGSVKIQRIRRNIELSRRPVDRAPQLDRSILSAVTGRRVVLRISKLVHIAFMDEANALKRDIRFWLPKNTQPLPYLILPIYDYVERAVEQQEVSEKVGTLLASDAERG